MSQARRQGKKNTDRNYGRRPSPSGDEHETRRRAAYPSDLASTARATVHWDVLSSGSVAASPAARSCHGVALCTSSSSPAAKGVLLMVGGLTEGRRHCKDVAMAFLKSDSTDVRADWRPVHGSPPFDALTHFSCCAVGDCVLVWGGLGSPSDSQPAVRGSAHLFDPQTRRWYVPRVDTPDEDSPCARYLHATCQHGRGMIIHGGIGREPPDKAVKMCGPDAVLSSTYQVECGRKRLRWIPIPAVTCKDHDEGNQSPAGRDCTPSGPLHKFGHAMCTLGGRLYTFGGFLVEHDSSSRPQRSHRDATTPSPHMRQDMITSKVTGSLHCLTLDGKTSEGSRSPAWMLLATDGGSLASPKPRFGHSMTAIDDRYIAVFGGFDDEGAAVPSDMVLLHFPTLIWSKPEVLGLPPSPRGYHSALGVGGQVLIFGGQEQRDDFIVDPALYVRWSSTRPAAPVEALCWK